MSATHLANLARRDARTTSKPVIVGYTESGAGRAAVRLAAKEAELRQASLVVLHELTGTEHPGRWGSDPDVHPVIGSVTRRITKLIRDGVPASVVVDLQLVTGSAATELVMLSDSAELVVVGVTTHHPLTAMILDTVTRAVADHAVSPVLLVPEETADEMIREIVCGVDRSNTSIAAMTWANAEAARRGVALTVVHLEPVGRGRQRLKPAGSPLKTWVRANLPAVATVTCSTEFGVRRVAQRLLEITAQHQAMLVVGAKQDPFRLARSVARVASSQTRVPVVLVPEACRSA